MLQTEEKMKARIVEVSPTGNRRGAQPDITIACQHYTFLYNGVTEDSCWIDPDGIELSIPEEQNIEPSIKAAVQKLHREILERT